MYRRSPAVEETTVGERAVLYHNVSGSAIVLNPTASLLWADLSDATDSDSLARSLHERFPKTQLEQVSSDVCNALEQMEKLELIVAE
jgi:hypothetical protein